MSHLERVTGVYARRRQELLKTAAEGDIDAACQLQRADDQRERRWRLREQADRGDHSAKVHVHRQRAAAIRYQVERAKRMAGDVEAIARYEERKKGVVPGAWRKNQQLKKRGAKRALKRYGPEACEPLPYTQEDAVGCHRRNDASGHSISQLVDYELPHYATKEERSSLGEPNLELAEDGVSEAWKREVDLKLRKQGLAAEREALERRLSEVEAALVEVQLQLELLGDEGVDRKKC